MVNPEPKTKKEGTTERWIENILVAILIIVGAIFILIALILYIGVFLFVKLTEWTFALARWVKPDSQMQGKISKITDGILDGLKKAG